MSLVAVYAGSFDPPTLGHLEVVRSAARFSTRLVVAVGRNSAKKNTFSLEERLDMLTTLVRNYPNVEVTSFDGLLVNFCRDQGIGVILRGLRAVTDFEYELGIAHANSDQERGIQTLFMPAEPQFSFVSSSFVRELASHGGRLDHYVAPYVEEKLRAKYSRWEPIPSTAKLCMTREQAIEACSNVCSAFLSTPTHIMPPSTFTRLFSVLDPVDTDIGDFRFQRWVAKGTVGVCCSGRDTSNEEIRAADGLNDALQRLTPWLLSQEQVFESAYDLLTEYAGATINPSTRQDFVFCFKPNQERRLTEWRFGGILGHGGKFWRHNGRLYINCYAEDRTPAVDAIIAKVNEALATLPYDGS